jgi:hypothetical protein
MLGTSSRTLDQELTRAAQAPAAPCNETDNVPFTGVIMQTVLLNGDTEKIYLSMEFGVGPS